MKNLDEKDLKILEILQKTADATSKEISKMLHVPITTVHHRIKRMKELGVIKKFTIDIDYEKLGMPISAYIFVEVDYNQLKTENITQHELVERFKKYPEIVTAQIITGDMDIIIKARTKTVAELDNFIVRILRNMGGISKTKTLLILHEGTA